MANDLEPSESGSVRPLTQKQEDLLLELFLQLSVDERRKVIKYCRDLLLATKEPDAAD